MTSSSFTANWRSVTGATSYHLDVATNSSFTNFVLNNLNVGNVTSHNVTGLTGNTSYWYRVRAYNGGGASANSNVITVTTSPAQVATPTFNPPGGLFCAHSVNVTVSTTTNGAQIRYTIDGSTPTSNPPNGTVIANGGTADVFGLDAEGVNLQAIGFKSGMTDSAVHSDLYYYDCGGDGPEGPNEITSTRNVTYNLDKAGNRTSVADTGTTTTYTPNNLNQYINTVGSDTITNGSEHEIAAYKGVSYTYINDTHLQSVTSGSNNYQLAYDALGRCVKRTLNNATTYYIYDGEKPIQEEGATLASTIYGMGVDEPVIRFTPSYVYYFYQDREGSVTHVAYSDTQGHHGLIEQYRYDVFGAPTIRDGNGNLVNPPGVFSDWQSFHVHRT